ncbi:hypothetical protein [Actinomadura sp. SCN-SB]|uniref:hypothetical protein n=1 Tax=Actinomadura sp. SCN-SB TaxID=3373092 RepID=UPI0037534666
MRNLVNGVIAGAVGTTALNIASYLDMAVRGRSGSSTPEQSVERLAGATGVDLGTGERAENRKTGLGALLGYGVGLAAGAGYGLLAGGRRVPWPAGALAFTVLAMVGSNAPMTLLGVTDPRRWSAADWVSDVVPHLAYGMAAASVYGRI